MGSRFSEELRSEIKSLYEKGLSYNRIERILNDRGIKISSATVGIICREEPKQILEKKQKRDIKKLDKAVKRVERKKQKREVRKKDTYLTNGQKTWILTLYRGGNPCKEIKDYCEQANINISLDQIERMIKEDKAKEKRRQERKRTKVIDVNTAIKDIFLSGLTVEEWINKNPERREWIKEQIQQRIIYIKQVAKHVGRRKDGTWRKDESFLEVLDIISTPGVMPRQLAYRNLSRDINEKPLDLIRNRSFEDRKDMYTYLLNRFVVAEGHYIMSPFDQKLYNQFNERLEGKVDQYNRIAQKLEETEVFENKIKQGKANIARVNEGEDRE